MPIEKPTIVIVAQTPPKDFDPWTRVRGWSAHWRPILLDSGGDVEQARYSIFAARPTRWHAVGARELRALARGERHERLYGPLTAPDLNWRFESSIDPATLPFVGGWLGRIDYEAGVLCAAREIACREYAPTRSVLRFGFYPRAFVWDRIEHRLYRIEVRGWEPARVPISRCRPQLAEPADEAARYCARVERARQLIAAGDLYQVNLSAELVSRTGHDARRLYAALRTQSPAPYGAFCAEPGVSLLCNSPELHFRTRGTTWMTQPIKGTRARSTDPAIDAAARAELLGSPKDRAELVMIVDLYRNDLGRLAEAGSVQVPSGIALRSFANVHHLMADVVARVPRKLAPATALRALFPAGSITGAPKQRAMEVIRELEDRDRGIYCGSVGAVDVRGEMMFNVAIRSAEIVRGSLRLRMGAGIVADSQPHAELAELHAKAAAWNAALLHSAAAVRSL